MPQRPRAFVTGITGQDGSYLAELLLAKGYEVFGLVRRASTFSTARLAHLYQDPHDADVRLKLIYGDVLDGASLSLALRQARPGEVYHLAAQSHVRVSFDMPVHTADATGVGTLRVLEAVREVCPEARVFHAGSSEQFGNAAQAPQSEDTPFRPRSPYACAKVFAFHAAVNYREAYGLAVSNGILFNHESPRRGETFVSRKITRAVARIHRGLDDTLFLGNLDARRDWGFAGDYVDAMWRMLQRDTPDDYVVATGVTHSVRDFLEAAFGHVGRRWQDHVQVDPRYLRPAEVDALQGDASKARAALGWSPTVGFEELVRTMVEADLESLGDPGRG